MDIAALAQLPRGAATKSFLKMEWDYPVYTPAQEAPVVGTAPVALRRALPLEQALRLIAGDDPRPLLVLRECTVCNKTDDALLKGGPDNDRTLVLARWFHCVKLPVDVVEENHPFNALFPTNDSEHMFVALADGSARIPMESDGSRTELWAGMSRILGSAYEKDPSRSYGDVLKRLDKLDVLDAQVLDLEARRGLEMESPRPDRKKVDGLENEISAVKTRIADEKAAIEKAMIAVPKTKSALATAPAAR